MNDKPRDTQKTTLKQYSKALVSGLRLLTNERNRVSKLTKTEPLKDVKLRFGEKDFNYYYLAAKNGDLESQFKVGCAYLLGEGVEQSDREALAWFVRAGEEGCVKSQCMVGYMHVEGKGVKTDEFYGVYWYTRAAQKGYTYAQNVLAGLYLDGEIVAQCYKTAREWYEKLVEVRDVDGLMGLGKLYENGWGVDKDLEKAKGLYFDALIEGSKESLIVISNVLFEAGNIEAAYAALIAAQKCGVAVKKSRLLQIESVLSAEQLIKAESDAYEFIKKANL